MHHTLLSNQCRALFLRDCAVLFYVSFERAVRSQVMMSNHGCFVSIKCAVPYVKLCQAISLLVSGKNVSFVFLLREALS